MADEYIPVRLSHLLRHCSVGAIVRGPESLMVVPDIREWGGPNDNPLEREIRYVDQVRSALGIGESLCRPPIAKERHGWKTGWIPALRFPAWMRCLTCGLLHRRPWKDGERSGTNCWGAGPVRTGSMAGKDGTSGECAGRLEQVSWVLVHKEGYLADVPWHDLAHAGAREEAGDAGECRRDWREPYLTLVERLAGRPEIHCRRCRSRGLLESRYPHPAGTWQQPWLREPLAEPAEEPAWVMEINDVRVHSPVTGTALVIPPESRIRRGTVVDRLHSSSRQQRRIRRARNWRARNSIVRRLAGEYGCAPEEIEHAVVEIDKGYPLYGQSVSVDDLRKSEYGALTDRIPDLRDDEDFVTRHHSASWRKLRDRFARGIARRAIDTVDRLVAVDRLKEIMVSRGFNRVGGDRLPPDIVGESDWLPAVELYGEGIFFTLNEAVLARWEAVTALHQRADAFARRYHQSDLQDRPPDIFVTPRLLLCHTLAHLLIRQLETVAGYPAASLKERLYSAGGGAPGSIEPAPGAKEIRADAGISPGGPPADIGPRTNGEEGPAGKSPMAGILIYVAVADEEGSLGGLAELAEPERFLRLLTGALEAANWCSLDPVCGEREGHGPGLLNGAACHACALAPETSCEHGNILLDRTFVQGDGADIPAFLDCVGASSGMSAG